jgi:hypothetical protein
MSLFTTLVMLRAGEDLVDMVDEVSPHSIGMSGVDQYARLLATTADEFVTFAEGEGAVRVPLDDYDRTMLTLLAAADRSRRLHGFAPTTVTFDDRTADPDEWRPAEVAVIGWDDHGFYYPSFYELGPASAAAWRDACDYSATFYDEDEES